MGRLLNLKYASAANIIKGTAGVIELQNAVELLFVKLLCLLVLGVAQGDEAVGTPIKLHAFLAEAMIILNIICYLNVAVLTIITVETLFMDGLASGKDVALGEHSI